MYDRQKFEPITLSKSGKLIILYVYYIEFVCVRALATSSRRRVPHGKAGQSLIIHLESGLIARLNINDRCVPREKLDYLVKYSFNNGRTLSLFKVEMSLELIGIYDAINCKKKSNLNNNCVM